MISEFELIQKYFSQQYVTATQVVRGVGDDCAIIAPQKDRQLAISTDTLIEGVHFPVHAPPDQVARRALTVNLSDLAAMGATPGWFLLALTLPRADSHWLEQFSLGLSEVAARFSCPLVGGDTTRGALSMTLQVGGFVDSKQLLTRDGAAVGDEVYVTGYLGDSALGLRLINGELTADDHMAKNYLLERYYYPTPRIDVGQALTGIATAAIDVSDGLVADAHHIAQKSQLSLVIERDRLPLSQYVLSLIPEAECRSLALTSGDDYELCFCLPSNCEHWVSKVSSQTGTPITRVGRAVAAKNGEYSVNCVDQYGVKQAINQSGYRHF